MPQVRYVKASDAYLAKHAGDSPAKSTNKPLLLGARLHIDTTVATTPGWAAANTVPDDKGDVKTGFINLNQISDQQQLKVFYTDVGQGDATLIEAQGGIVIIDGGPNKAFHEVLNKRLKTLQRADQDVGLSPRTHLFINAVVVSHFDKDHFYGLTSLFNNKDFHFGHLYHNGLPRYGVNTTKDLDLGDVIAHNDGSHSISTDLSGIDSAKTLLAANLLKAPAGGDNLFAKFLRAVIAAKEDGRLTGMQRLYRRSTTGAPQFIKHVGNDMAFEVLAPITTKASGPIRLPVFPDPHDVTPTNPQPEGSESHTINGNSVVLKLRYKNKLFLFGGDLNQPAQKYLSQKYGTDNPFSAHVNKACHHGSSDFDLNYLKDVSPEATVFSSGDNGSYDHPLPDAMGAAAKHSKGDFPLVFSTELARDNKTTGKPMLGHINARSNGDEIVMAQKKEKKNTKNPWHTFALPYPGPFGGH
jgi:beta-lactamase superfamily II metal-dependent hydrolase